MDFGNPKKLRILTICVLFRVLKRLEEEEGGGGWHIVADFVTRLMRPSTFLKNQTEDAHLHNWRTRNMIPLLFQSSVQYRNQRHGKSVPHSTNNHTDNTTHTQDTDTDSSPFSLIIHHHLNDSYCESLALDIDDDAEQKWKT